MNAEPRTLTFADFIDLERVGAPVVSPDGRQVLFTVSRPDLDADKNRTDIYWLSIDGGEPVRLTTSGTSNTSPAWSPDGRSIAFTSNRGGVNQIWVLPAGGGEARRVTDLRLGAREPVWFPDGRRLLAVSPVYGDHYDALEIDRREEAARERSPAPRIIDDLMYRHWDSWTDDKIDHLFSVTLDGSDVQDLTPGPYPVPARSLAGSPAFAVSPDGTEICFVSLRDPAQALSTNLNLWTIPAEGGDPKRISPGAGANICPVYSPDNNRLAWCAMRRAGYEADRLDLTVLDRKTGDLKSVAPDFDLGAGAPAWSPDAKTLFFSTDDSGTRRVYRVAAAGGTPEPVTSGAVDSRPAITPDGARLVFSRETMLGPAEIYSLALAGGKPAPLTHLNEDRLSGIEMADGEDFWFEGARGERVHGLIVRPPGFEAGKSYPTVFLIHGGPQGMFSRDFHARWCPQMFAASGYVVVMINPRGSTGYGQDFTDAIRFQWGGDCYQDLVRGFDYVLEHYDFCDAERTAAAGASFGGFMVNWIAGHTDRFRCLVSHDGVFNTEMGEYLTDELWFNEWECGGAPWENPEEHGRYSPHRFVGNMKTPMLVIQGEKDYRCTTAEGFGLFTGLKRRGVPSRLLYFHDEGHWVLGPKNRETWWATVLDWLERYLKH